MSLYSFFSSIKQNDFTNKMKYQKQIFIKLPPNIALISEKHIVTFAFSICMSCVAWRWHKINYDKVPELPGARHWTNWTTTNVKGRLFIYEVLDPRKLFAHAFVLFLFPSIIKKWEKKIQKLRFCSLNVFFISFREDIYVFK